MSPNDLQRSAMNDIHQDLYVLVSDANIQELTSHGYLKNMPRPSSVRTEDFSMPDASAKSRIISTASEN